MQSAEIEIITDQFVFFWRPPTVFGQWTWSEFVVDGERYTCAEQFMMAEKARLFQDEEGRARILYRGNIAKFSQNPDMLRQLLATGDRILVEASPLDRIWGIGLRGDDPRASDRASWQGLNLLGEALMRVRATLSQDA
jgi:predicted NAD-dependent protein-ADP-ribosyltransferase YbiA (DUF1768 family)